MDKDPPQLPFKIGFGYDLHRLVHRRKLILGGVEIPYPRGLNGHSDADALTHAIIDALFGAAAMRDIGYHFPDNDPNYKDIDSQKLLSETQTLIQNAGFKIGNIDATIIAEEPKLQPHITPMCNQLATTLKIHPSQITIKATTNEKVGALGRKEAIAAHAVCLLYTN